jgi:hypothetical protein
MFRPLSGSLSGLYNVLRKCSTCLGFHKKKKTENVLLFLSSLYSPDVDPDKGRNIVAKVNVFVLGKELC